MTVELSSPVWRSLLYVPANVERYVAKAHERGADGIILDLEDSIPLAEKRNARDNIQSAMRSVGQHGGDVLVRINRPLNLAVLRAEEPIEAVEVVETALAGIGPNG